MKGPILILGATSSIARHTAYAWAEKGHSLFLAGRDMDELQRLAWDIKVRYGVETKTGFFEAEKFETHAPFFDQVIQTVGQLEGVLVAFGFFGEPRIAQNDFAAAKAILDSNFTGACSILTYCSNYFAKIGRGFIVAISSVAGDRGRQSGYIYGAAKAGLNAFLQGLRNRLYPAGVRVITVKPGYVDTAMTFGKPGMFLVANPEKVGRVIAAAPWKKKDVIYVPWFWRAIMWIVRSIPECLFKRLKL